MTILELRNILDDYVGDGDGGACVCAVPSYAPDDIMLSAAVTGVRPHGWHNRKMLNLFLEVSAEKPPAARKPPATDMYVLRYKGGSGDPESGALVVWTLDEILEEINRDRSEEWTDYDESDWKEGLSMTDYELVGAVVKGG